MLIEPGQDRVEVRGALVQPGARHSYLALNKPEGYITTASDPGSRPTINELLTATGRVFPIGRLDMDSRGLLLLTDDGELANLLTHPRYEVPKTYLVRVERAPVRDRALRALRDGVSLEDGITAPARVRRVEAGLVELTIHEGRVR